MFKLKEIIYGLENKIDENSYSCRVTIVITIDEETDFVKEINVISTNDMTGHQVDEQRLNEAMKIINSFN